MASFAKHPVLRAVRRALGRDQTPDSVPPPPELEQPLIRLVHSELGLPELFAARAKENKLTVHWSTPDELASSVVARVRELGLTSVICARSRLLEQLAVGPSLAAAGVEVGYWPGGADEVGADVLGGKPALQASYDVDAGLTDAWAAVAETGSVVVRAGAGHGRALSLVPPYHLVVLEPRVFVPDLFDLFEKMGRENDTSGFVIISGPSKTADIEMNLVTGVHGPGQVEVWILK